jgi:hypothetical protein
MLLNRGTNRARVIVAMASTADMRFVERSSWWPSSSDSVSGHMTSPTYSAGHVFADEMVYPLMMSWRKQGLITFCRNLTDSLLDPVELKLYDLPEHLLKRAETSAFRYSRAAKAPPLQSPLESVLTYGELRKEMLQLSMLTLGLYRPRSVQITPDKVLRVLPYVFTNPPNSTRVRDNDRVYALMQHPAMRGQSVRRPRGPRSRRRASRRSHPCPSTDRVRPSIARTRAPALAAVGAIIEEAARKIQSHFRTHNLLALRWTRARIAEFERDGVFTSTHVDRGIFSHIGRGLRQAINVIRGMAGAPVARISNAASTGVTSSDPASESEPG